MAMSTTHAQAELLAFIARYQEENNGVSPSYEEMMEGLGSTSKSGIHRMLCALEGRKRIRRMFAKSRAIEILPEDGTPEPRSTLEQIPSNELLAELKRRGEIFMTAAA